MPNQQIGPYTIERLIGSGGMSDVYLAVERASRQPAALKVLRAAAGKEIKLQKRSEREAALLMQLRHPHIVQVYGAGRTPDGRHYIAMEYVSGGSLDDLLNSATRPKPTVTETVYLMRRVAEAVAYAHDAGIVHRDLKPGNILLRADSGEPVVTDLGIAAFAGANPLTGTMESLGTPQYMAPEQVNRHQTDGRADVYAIGVMLFEMLTGRLPFEGENNWAILLAKRDEAAPPILSVRRDLDPGLAAVVDACLQRDPAARYQTAGALAATLAAFLPADARPPMPALAPGRAGAATPRSSKRGTPRGAAVPAGAPTPATEGGRRSALLWAGVGGLALLALLALFISALGGGRAGPEPTAPPGVAGIEPANEDAPATVAVSGPPTSTLAAGAPQSTNTPAPAATKKATATRRPATATRPPAPDAPAVGVNAFITSTPEVSAGAQPALTLIDPPPAACPPPLNSPHYSGNRNINFRWQLSGAPAEGSSFAVQVGPFGGSAPGRGPDSLAGQTTGNEWVFPVSVSSIYQDGTNDYQWRVVYRVPGRPDVVSPASCFRITSDGGGEQPTMTPSPELDRDGDGVPDSQDQCPDEPQSANPDPSRPGCPMPTPPPPIDSDGDGVPDDQDWCPYEPEGPYPDPYWPGCPAAYP